MAVDLNSFINIRLYLPVVLKTLFSLLSNKKDCGSSLVSLIIYNCCYWCILFQVLTSITLVSLWNNFTVFNTITKTIEISMCTLLFLY